MVMSAEYKSKFAAFTSISGVSMWVKNGTWNQNKQTKTLNFLDSQVTDCWIVHCSLSYQKIVSAPLQKKIKGRLNKRFILFIIMSVVFLNIKSKNMSLL